MRSSSRLSIRLLIAAEIMLATPEEFAARLQSDRERFGAVVREANIRVE